MSRKGPNDSSEHRVVPMMRYMMENKNDLVKLLKRKGISVRRDEIKNENVFFGSKKQGYNGEKALPPSREYLCKLIETLPENEHAKKAINSIKNLVTKQNRLDLIEKEDNRKEACVYINNLDPRDPLKRNDFQILEGNSYPDVFIETDDKVIVIEGKWTEPGIKEYTTYQINRNQMVRHIHNAINYVRINNNNKQVYGFYIVSKKFEDKWKENLSKEGFEKILEYQFGIEKEKEDIKEAYKGCITWEKIVEMFPNVADKKRGWKCIAD